MAPRCFAGVGHAVPRADRRGAGLLLGTEAPRTTRARRSWLTIFWAEWKKPERPTEAASKPGTPTVLVVLRREKKCPVPRPRLLTATPPGCRFRGSDRPHPPGVPAPETKLVWRELLVWQLAGMCAGLLGVATAL